MKHILLSNDDGINAKGLSVLEDALSKVPGIRTTTVAPLDQQSASSHSLTIHDPVRIAEHGPNRYSVSGTPTDCVLIAVQHILPEDPPDIIISGINHGANMGEDVTYSGTVAAALEGAILGFPSFAISNNNWSPKHWDTCSAYIQTSFLNIMDFPQPDGTLLNINIPDLPINEIKGLRSTRLGSRVYQDAITEQVDPRGKKYIWIAGSGPTWDNSPDTDATLNNDGYIVVTPLCVDMTCFKRVETLKEFNFDGSSNLSLPQKRKNQ
jgi:5'-nucleotidase